MDFIKSLLNDFNPADYMPALDTVLGKVELVVRIAVLVGPLVLLGLGLWYFLAPPKEANRSAGYRCYFGMGSVEAWQFTQRLAGIVWSVLGLVLTVVMALICNGFRGMEAMDMVWLAVKCILWQLGLIVVSCIAINITLAALFDSKGSRRNARKES